MKTHEIRKPVQRMYSRLNYFQFCEYMGLNPSHDMKYWQVFQQFAQALAVFDDVQLQKIIDYPEE